MDTMNDRHKTAIAIAVAVAVLVLALVLPNARRARDYKRAILLMESGTDYIRNCADTTDVVRLVGKPDKLYYQLPKIPRYRHFWD